MCCIEETITISKKVYEGLLKTISDQAEIIKSLEQRIKLLEAGRNSSTSSTPSSQDYKYQTRVNLREKTSRKSGGQKGHKGSTLKMSTLPDDIIEYKANYCKGCGNILESTDHKLYKKRQEIVIPPIAPKYIEHQNYSCSCSQCGTQTIAEMPSHLKANIQYGKNIQSLVAYLSVYQLLPAKRLTQMLKEVLNIEMSQGTIFNILSSMSQKALPAYEVIRQRLQQSKCVGGDETGIHIDKRKAWFWIFQNRELTFIHSSYSRGFNTILDVFPQGLPKSFYVSDSLSAQLKINSFGKQLCLAHLLRELKKFEEVFQSEWATRTKILFIKALDYKRTMLPLDYSSDNSSIVGFENELTQLLNISDTEKHKKEKAFINRLRKRRNAIFTFLYHIEVPPDNNASERGIRNIKVKMKISNQFKSYHFAQHFAIIRSVIDTAIKNGQDVFNALTNLAGQNLRSAE